MPVSLDIVKSRGIVYLKYWDYVTVQQAQDSLAAHANHPDAVPGQKHLADFSAITGFEHAYVEMLALQAEVADVVLPEGQETLLVMLATHPVALELATLVRRSWQDVSAVIPLIAESEAQALELLGVSESNLDELVRLSQI